MKCSLRSSQYMQCEALNYEGGCMQIYDAFTLQITVTMMSSGICRNRLNYQDLSASEACIQT